MGKVLIHLRNSKYPAYPAGSAKNPAGYRILDNSKNPAGPDIWYIPTIGGDPGGVGKGQDPGRNLNFCLKKI